MAHQKIAVRRTAFFSLTYFERLNMSLSVLACGCRELSESIALELKGKSKSNRLINPIMSLYAKAVRYIECSCGAENVNERKTLLENAHSAICSACSYIGIIETAHIIDNKICRIWLRKSEKIKNGIEKMLNSKRISCCDPNKIDKPLFSSKRLYVRPFQLDDGGEYLELCKEKDFDDFDMPVYCNIDDLKDICTSGNAFTVLRKNADTPVGFLFLGFDGNGSSRLRASFSILNDLRKQGYGSELLMSLKEYALKIENNVLCLYLPCSRGNTLSMLHKLGFEAEGVLRGYGKKGEDVVVMSITNI